MSQYIKEIPKNKYVSILNKHKQIAPKTRKIQNPKILDPIFTAFIYNVNRIGAKNNQHISKCRNETMCLLVNRLKSIANRYMITYLNEVTELFVSTILKQYKNYNFMYFPCEVYNRKFIKTVDKKNPKNISFFGNNEFYNVYGRFINKLNIIENAHKDDIEKLYFKYDNNKTSSDIQKILNDWNEYIDGVFKYLKDDIKFNDFHNGINNYLETNTKIVNKNKIKEFYGLYEIWYDQL